jgi:hypothetical protein
LVVHANNDALAGQRLAERGRRAERYALLDALHKHSTLDRVRACGRVRRVAGAGVPVVVREGRAFFAGLVHCASVWACPVCSVWIRSRRAAELGAMIDRQLVAGGGVTLVTLTTRHDQGDALAAVLDAVANGWRSVIGSKGWRQDVETFGIEGWSRALEITVGDNGWHPHVHALLFSDRPLSASECRALGDRLHARWVAVMERAGRSLPTRSAGVDVRAVRDPDVGAYVVGVSASDGRSAEFIGLEMTRPDLKQARRAGSRTVHALWCEVAMSGDARAVALVNEYEGATHGRRSLTSSRGLKARLLVEDLSDEAVVAETVAVVVGDVVVVVLTDVEYRQVVVRGLRARLLDAAEAAVAGDGGEALCGVLRAIEGKEAA